MKTSPPSAGSSLQRLWRHWWLDASDAHRLLGNDGLDRLEAAVRASEARHRGQICLCVEASLPPRYLWQALRSRDVTDVIRQRALSVFAKQQVWDTAENNGILIYVLLAERHLELLADRALAATLTTDEWQQLHESIRGPLANGLEDGLQAAIRAIDQVLQHHFPAAGEAASNELPDRARLL